METKMELGAIAADVLNGILISIATADTLDDARGLAAEAIHLLDEDMKPVRFTSNQETQIDDPLKRFVLVERIMRALAEHVDQLAAGDAVNSTVLDSQAAVAAFKGLADGSYALEHACRGYVAAFSR